MATVALHLINSDAGPQTVKANVGDVYRLGAWVYPKVGNHGGGTLALVLYCTDTTGHNTPTTVTAATETVPATGSWTFLSGTATVPAGYTTIDPQLTLTSVPTSDTVYVDDALVREVTDAAAAQTTANAATPSGGASGSLATWLNTLFGSPSGGTVLQIPAIPSLDASKIISGSLTGATVPGSQLTGSVLSSLLSGAVALGLIPSLPASQITSGIFGSGLIPSLDASKVTTGMFGTGLIPNITTAMSSDLQATIDNIYQAVFGADPSYSSVVALLHLNGPNGSTTFTDSSPLASDFTGSGGAAISTTQGVFGGGSAATFPGSTDYLAATAPASDFAFGTDDFTIECWVYLPSAISNKGIYDGRPGAVNGAYPTLYLLSSAPYYYVNSGVRITGSALSLSTWHHIAVSRSGTSTKMFVDGTQVGSTYADSNSYINSTGYPTVGSMYNRSGYNFPGYLNELRVTNGVARYTANFTAPTVPFTPGSPVASVETSLTSIPGGNIASALLASVIPALDASKITTGSLTGATVPGSQLTGSVLSSLLSGAVALGLIPSLPASQVTSGTFGAGLIPALDASKITTGALGAARIPSLPASQITSGTFATSLIPSLAAGWGGTLASSLLSGAVALGLIPSLPASQITSGVFGAGFIPSLDASKVTTGTFAQTMVTGLTALWSGWFGTTTPTGASDLLVGTIPALPASQITSGIFGSGLIPALDASKITSGSLTGATVPGSQLTGSVLSSLLSGAVALGLIPALPASQVTTGTFGAGLIPALDASKITTGALATARIPSLPTSQITSGTFLSSFLPMLGLKQTAGTNLVLDPSFETASAWAGVEGSQSSDQSLSGNYSWMFQGTGAGSVVSDLLVNDVAMMPVHTRAGEIFQSQIWVYPKVGNAGGGTLYLRLQCTDSTGTLGQTFVTATNIEATPATGSWSLLSGFATVPAGYDTVQVQFIWTTAPTTDYIYVDDVLIREVTLAQSTIGALFSGGTVGSTILAAAVPSLDASKITTGSLTGATVPGSQLTGSVLSSLLSGAVALGLIPALPASQVTSGTFGAGLIPALDASKITTGTLGTSRVPSLPATQVTSGTFPSGVTFPAAQLGTGAVPTGVTLPGSQLTGSVLSSLLSGAVALGLIPSLPASQVTSGTFGSALIPSLDASKITTGALATAQIPALDAAKVTTGTFTATQIPALDAAKVTTGTFTAAQIPALNASKITAGAFSGVTLPGSALTGSVLSSLLSGAVALGLIPSLPASQITSGTLGSGLIPALDASKITSGSLTGATVPGGQITGTGAVAASVVGNVLGGASLGADITSWATALYGGAAVQPATTVEQDIAAFLSNAISGGNAPTSLNSPVAFLDNLLGVNGIPHTNVAIPPSPGPGTITHDQSADGTPFVGSSNSVTVGPFNITPGANANYVTVRVGWYTAATGTLVPTATCAGAAMSLLSTETSADNSVTTQIWGMANPTPLVANAIEFQVHSPLYGLIYMATATADTYIGVGSVGAANGATGTVGSPALTLASATGNYILHTAAAETASGSETLTVSTPAGYVAQYNSGSIGSGNYMAVLAGDVAGAASVSFADTASRTTADRWVACAVNLIPLSASIIGSGFRQYSTSSGTGALSHTKNIYYAFPAGFFDTLDQKTADYSYNSATNTLTILNAGWYTFKIASLMAVGINNGTGIVVVNAALYQNGGLYEVGIGGGVSANALAGTMTAARFGSVFHGVQVSAGDTFTPMYYLDGNGTPSSLSFSGSGGGYSGDTYFGAAVQNRSLM